MPRVMTLDGLSVSHLDEVRQRFRDADQPWWRRPVGLGGVTDVARARWPWVALGLLAGGYLAGSARGQRLLKQRARR